MWYERVAKGIRDWLSKRRRFGLPAGAIFWLLGLPGHLDDAGTWRKWMDFMLNASWEWWNVGLLFLGTVSFLYAVAPERVVLWFRDRFRTSQRTEGQKDGMRRIEQNEAQRAKEPPLVQPERRVQPLDRQPLDHAYRILRYMGAYQGEGDERTGISYMLRQAALDGDITIWGVEYANQPPDHRLLLKIPPNYWANYAIDAASYENSVLTGPDSIPKKLYWNLHADMNEIRVKWANSVKRSNRWDWIVREPR